jgi:hypothetical protein
MKKVIVKNLDGIQTHGAEMEDPTAWIAECEASLSFGLPDEYSIEIIDTSYDFELQDCIKNRKSEYPTMEEFMNAYFDGGEMAVHDLQQKRLAIKAKYPKPIKEQE